MRNILVVLTVLFFLAGPAMGFSRSFTLKTDGDVQVHNSVGGEQGWTSGAVRGRGQVDYRSWNFLRNDRMRSQANLSLARGEDDTRRLAGMLAARGRDDHNYQLMIRPHRDSAAEAWLNYTTASGLYNFLNIDAGALVADGELRVNTHVVREARTVSTTIRAIGKSEFNDVIYSKEERDLLGPRRFAVPAW